MKVLIVGSGGREHAIATAVAKSPKVDKIYCAPGNAGIAALAECVAIGAMEFDKLVAFAKEKEIDLVIVGMDDPLVGGLVDEMEKAGIRTEIDLRNEKINLKIRESQMQKVPYMLVLGDKEVEQGVVAVRSRKEGSIGTMTVEELIAKLQDEVDSKAL